jgi:DNA polymerase I-like protein with 3'-5' exonuclease and polymerase domains
MNIIMGLPQVNLVPGAPLAIDSEFFGQVKGKLHRPSGRFACLQMCAGEDVYLITDPLDIPKAMDWAKDGQWIIQNSSYDITQLRKYAEIKPRPIFDTMLVERNLFNGYYDSFALPDLTRRWLQIHMDKEARDDFETMTELDPEHIQYAARDAYLLLKVYQAQQHYIDKHQFNLKPYWEIDEPCMWAILDMQPVKIDVAKWLTTVKGLELRGRAIEAEIGLNVYSPNQVKERLSRELGKNLQDTAAETLHEFDGNPLVDKILIARMCRKAESTYGEKWLEENLEAGDLVYPSWKTIGTETFRQACCVAGDTILETSMGKCCISELSLTDTNSCSIISHRGRWCRISQKIYKGKFPMYLVETSQGNSIKCTMQHRLLTPDGWRKLQDVTIGSSVCTDDSTSFSSRKRSSLSPIRKGFCSSDVGVAIIRQTNSHPVSSDFSAYLGHDTQILWQKPGVPRAHKDGDPQAAFGGGKRKSQGKTSTINSSFQVRIGNRYSGWPNGMGNGKAPWNFSISDTPEFEISQVADSSHQVTANEARRSGSVGEAGIFCAGSDGGYLPLCRKSSPIFLSPISMLHRTYGNANFYQKARCTPSLFSAEQENTNGSYCMEPQSKRDHAIPCIISAGNPSHSTTGDGKVLGGFLPSPKELSYRSERVNSQTGTNTEERRREIGVAEIPGIRGDGCFRHRGKTESRSDCFEYPTEVITAITYLGIMDTWDIQVEDDHSYVSQGLIHHNSDPNMQNIPTRKLPEYREAVVSQHGLLTKGDGAQQEPRTIACISGDPEMIKAFQNGEDIHLTIAKTIYHNPNLTKADNYEERQVGKTTGLALSYGMEEEELAKRLGISLAEATDFRANFFKRFRGVQVYIDKMRREVLQKECIYTIGGHKVWINNHNYQSKNNAVNSPVQGSSADMQKLWLVKNWRACLNKQWPFYLCLAVHDELVMDHPAGLKDEVRQMMTDTLRETAEALFGTTIPFPAELGSGKNWRVLDE